MKAVFEYADGDQHNVTFPSKPRGIYKRNKTNDIRIRPCRVTFVNKPIVCNREEEKWIWFCQQAIRPLVFVDDMSDSPVSQDTKESIVKLMTEKAKTDKVSTGMALIPWHSILAIGKIFVEGLRYGKDNWKKGVGDKEYQEERLEHALTHFALWKEGDRSEAHLAKVAWFCVTQLELERLEQLQNPSRLPHVLTVEDVGTHNSHCTSVSAPITRPASAESITTVSAKTISEINYELYREALSKHFGKTVHSYTHWADRIEIQFQSSFDRLLVLYYDKDHDKVAALPDIKLYKK